MVKTKPVLERLQKSWAFAWVAAAMLALSQLKDATEGFDRLMVAVGLKPDALSLAASSEKGAFARDFSEVAWRRIYWARVVIGRIERKWSKDEISEAYKAYVQASETWATKMMTFVTYTERFHGTSKAVQLESSVVKAMNDLAEQVASLRHADQPSAASLVSAHKSVDLANEACYHFVRGISPTK